jgi:hypothetical protein
MTQSITPLQLYFESNFCNLVITIILCTHSTFKKTIVYGDSTLAVQSPGSGLRIARNVN